MADNGSRRGATNLGVPLMIVAFVAIGGFMYWLNLQAAEYEASRVVEVQEEPADPGTIEGAVTVAAEEIQLDASPYEGQMVTLPVLPVASQLGTQGFWLEMPNRNPFLVSLNDDLMAQGISATQGQSATVTGMILAVNDSILTVWSDAGTISEGDRLAAEFATHFIEAALVRVESGPGGDGGEG